MHSASRALFAVEIIRSHSTCKSICCMHVVTSIMYVLNGAKWSERKESKNKFEPDREVSIVVFYVVEARIKWRENLADEKTP